MDKPKSFIFFSLGVSPIPVTSQRWGGQRYAVMTQTQSPQIAVIEIALVCCKLYPSSRFPQL